MGKAIGDSLPMAIAQHNAVITSVLCLIIGAKLIGDAISALT